MQSKNEFSLTNSSLVVVSRRLFSSSSAKRDESDSLSLLLKLRNTRVARAGCSLITFSKLSLENSKTSQLEPATRVAKRGDSSTSAISPMKSPGPRMAIRRGATVSLPCFSTRTVPLKIRSIVLPGSPSVNIVSPGLYSLDNEYSSARRIRTRSNAGLVELRLFIRILLRIGNLALSLYFSKGPQKMLWNRFLDRR